MKVRRTFEVSNDTRIRAEVDAPDVTFAFPRHLLWRFVWQMAVFVGLALVAVKFQQRAAALLPLVFGAALIAIQVFIHGYFPGFLSDPRIDPVRVYGKRTLIFLIGFWAVLFAVVFVLLWLRLPD